MVAEQQGTVDQLHSAAVPVLKSQEQVHTMDQAIYDKEISLTAGTGEGILRAADFLGMACISDACQRFIRLHIMTNSLSQVSTAPLDWRARIILACL